jgi:hypothetical protein
MAHPSRSGSPSGAQNRRCSEQPGQSQSQRTHPSPRSAAVNAASVQPYASCTAEAGASRTVRGGAAVSTRGVASARQSRPLLPGDSESSSTRHAGRLRRRCLALESPSGPHVIVLDVYRAVVDVRAAEWVVAGLRGFGESVLSVAPACFAEYVRVFHPAYRSAGSDRVTVAWAEIASANGRPMHAGVQLGAITGSERYEWEGQAGVFDQPPETGNLPRELLDPLADVLARHTRAPGTCYFAVWDGWGWLPPEVRSAPKFSVPQRTYHLLAGPVEAVRELADAWQPLGVPRSPNLWWPQDHAWCVATEVDFKTTYIGADRSCAQELIALPEVEAATVSPDLGIDWLSDTLNPRQAGA